MNSTRKTISKVLLLHVLDSELQGLLFQCARLSLISDVARDVFFPTCSKPGWELQLRVVGGDWEEMSHCLALVQVRKAG